MAFTPGLLTLSGAAFVIVGLVVAYLVIDFISNDLKLRRFQGPPLARFSRLWLVWQGLNARVNKAQFEAIEKYGSVCRIGPDLLLTNDAEIIRHMNAPRSKWRRSGWYESNRFDPRQDTVFSTRDEKIHAELKAKEASAYNGRDIDSLEDDIDARTIDLISLIKTSYNGKVMDIASTTRFYTLDVLSTIAFGRPFGFLAANKDLWSYNKTLGDFFVIIELATSHQWFRWILATSFVQALAGPQVTDKVGLGPALGFARKAVAERFGPDAKVKNDMLGHFVSKGLNQEQCEAEAFLQIIAGSDSTTTILRCAMFMLSGNPTAYAKLRSEIDTAVQAGNMSFPVAKYSEVQNMPYLQACIWESLRVFPPLFGLKSKVAPPGGETVEGIFFPEGVEVASCDDAICRNKDIFGNDAHFYRPERWLEADAETRSKYERTVDTVFGSGRFLCLGRHIAMMELHKAIVELIRHFDWSIADPMKGITSAAHNVHIQSGMNLIARSRQ